MRGSSDSTWKAARINRRSSAELRGALDGLVWRRTQFPQKWGLTLAAMKLWRGGQATGGMTALRSCFSVIRRSICASDIRWA